MPRTSWAIWAVLWWGCGGDDPGDRDGSAGGDADADADADSDADADADADADSDADADADWDGEGWPEANEYSWNGSWSPGLEDFPIPGLYDDEYFDGHEGTPILPPGRWDWNDADDDLANWRNFSGHIGTFELLTDAVGHAYGWRLVGPEASIEFSGGSGYFEGSPGVDILDLGPQGSIHSLGKGEGNLGDGPDVLVFGQSYALDYRTGSSTVGHAHDDDLLIAGCGENPDGSFDYVTTTIHMGPGTDWAFVRNIDRAAVDLGNGASGRTDTLDPDDGNDLADIGGNSHDFRVMGGNGADVVVWHPDQNVQTTQWLGPDFFGCGGKGDAVWANDGPDRLVLDIPVNTQIGDQTPTPPGGLLVRGTDGSFIDDDPTGRDPFASYCVECGESPEGRRTMRLEYRNAADTVLTGYFNVTNFEELQIGIGDGALVFRLDDVQGIAVPAPDLEPRAIPTPPASYCQ
jgi:hypothetical protein